eukprot:656434-Prymnesium_polylepis.1
MGVVQSGLCVGGNEWEWDGGDGVGTLPPAREPTADKSQDIARMSWAPPVCVRVRMLMLVCECEPVPTITAYALGAPRDRSWFA